MSDASICLRLRDDPHDLQADDLAMPSCRLLFFLDSARSFRMSQPGLYAICELTKPASKGLCAPFPGDNQLHVVLID